jgi:hypothetical protein
MISRWTRTTSPTPIHSYTLLRDPKHNYFSNAISNSLCESISMIPPDFVVHESSLTPSQDHRSYPFFRKNVCASQEPFTTCDTQSIAETCHTTYTYKEPFHTPIVPVSIQTFRWLIVTMIISRKRRKYMVWEKISH